MVRTGISPTMKSWMVRSRLSGTCCAETMVKCTGSKGEGRKGLPSFTFKKSYLGVQFQLEVMIYIQVIFLT